MLEAVQHRATKCIKDLAGLEYKDRLGVLGLQSLETRRIRGDLIEVFKMFKGLSGLKFDDYFVRSITNLRGHKSKVFKKSFNNDFGKYQFSNRVFDMWNKLPKHFLDFDNICSFKNAIDKLIRYEWGLV